MITFPKELQSQPSVDGASNTEAADIAKPAEPDVEIFNFRGMGPEEPIASDGHVGELFGSPTCAKPTRAIAEGHAGPEPKPLWRIICIVSAYAAISLTVYDTYLK